MSQPCCPDCLTFCLDPADPRANYSSELPDQFIFYGNPFPPNFPGGPPRLGGDGGFLIGDEGEQGIGFDGGGGDRGRGTCVESQDCADQKAIENLVDQLIKGEENTVPPPAVPPSQPPRINDNEPRPPFQPQPPTIPPLMEKFCNEFTLCTAFCPDGSQTTHFVAAGAFCWFSQAQANVIATNFACKQARAARVCLSALSRAGACLNQAFGDTISITSGDEIVSFEVVSGALPTGLTLSQASPMTANIAGIPTALGLFTFSVRAFAANGNNGERTYTLAVVDIDPTLASGSPGDAYLDTLELVGAPAFVAGTAWSLFSGSLPPGLEIISNGNVFGTVDSNAQGGTYGFVVTAVIELTDGRNFICHKPAEIQIEDLPTLWWTLQSTSIGGGGCPGDFGWFDEIEGDVICSSLGTGTTTGKIGNGMQMGNQHPPNLLQSHAYVTKTPSALWDFDTAFTFTYWLNIVQNPSPGRFLLFARGISALRLIKDNGTLFSLQLRLNGILQSSIDFNFAYTLGTFFFVRMWYDEDNTEIGIQIDNGTKLTTGATPQNWSGNGSISGEDTTTLLSPFPVADWVIDEIGYWTFNIPDSLADFIWNGGAGQTFPFPP